ncbi:hypothetical protein P168DRAFT_229113 [Aspergillus campestris IBT 28561]|uniref:Cysteine protease n=1 Tax=Aspergillus campestris (strain IBT 28561) TaxID=1392248 RepID=A0A2I1DCR8_ASPC2|nr:uncharacterized protein P168DRAFT_229113 [Aspergillus campestris IBT 28561]PKY07678.1 hypothetical protein P168DRAFT_229113 [Aspergillus campestris IBT 28561]
MNNVDIGRYSKRIMQYIWDPEPQNDQEPTMPIWCLGEKYITHKSESDQTSQPKRQEDRATLHPTAHHGWPEEFLKDFESKVWMTYRYNFHPIPRSDDRDSAQSLTLRVRIRNQLVDSQGFTSDAGWGCMIRSGQSLLANTLLLLQLDRDWRYGQKVEEEAKVLSLFADHPNAPFSIHQFVKHGAESCGKHPGEWFGPSATARCIEALSSRCDSPNIRVYALNDTSEVFEERFMSIACDDSGAVQPTLILLGTMLGIGRVNPVYWDGLKASLQVPQSVGIAGGRPSASHYFVGVQGSYLFYLDPHSNQPSLPCNEHGGPYSKKDVESYHTRRLRRLHVENMDPSMLIGFLIRNREDWEDWSSRMSSVQGKPIIHVVHQTAPGCHQTREEALDEVEVLDDE